MTEPSAKAKADAAKEEDEALDLDPKRLARLVEGLRKVIDDVGPCTTEEVIRGCCYIICSGAIQLRICRGHLAHELIDTYDRLEKVMASRFATNLIDTLFSKVKGKTDGSSPSESEKPEPPS